MKAIIEIGTNSLKLLVFKTDPLFEVVLDRTIITRMGEGYNQTGQISLRAVKRNIEEIEECLKVIKSYQCSDVSLYGTMIFRSARNSEDALNEIYQETGLVLHVITGDQEAEYSFLAAMDSFPSNNEDILVIDTGGGSTEFIFGKNRKVGIAKSIDVGAVTLTERFGLDCEVDATTLQKCDDFLFNKFRDIKEDFVPRAIIGIGGTVTTLASIIQKLESYSVSRVHGSKVNLKDIIELEAELASKNIEKRKSIIGLSPKRADIILGGILIVKSILKKYGVNEMLVCDHGLRYGLALKEGRKQ